MHYLFSFFIGLFLGGTVVANRAAVCTKAVNLGVTFYTAKELEPILACAEVPFYNNPNDTDTIISNGKTCVINNSMNKALSALSLYNGFNDCTDLMALIDKLTKPFINQCKPVINKALNVLNKCKTNNQKTGTAKQNACMNQVYTNCMAMVTKQFVNKVCTAMSKKMSAKEWNCGKQYAPKVVNVQMYECYNIVNRGKKEEVLLLLLATLINSASNIGSNYPPASYIGYCPSEMRTDVGSIPLMCLLSTLTSSVLGYLPTEDLTNAIIPGGGFPPGETIIPTDGEEEGSPDEDTDSDGNESIYRKKVSTFRRRNINAPFGGRVPFSRMAYKAGYGSNRIGFSRNAGTPQQLGGYYGERNPYGTVNIGGSSFPPHVVPDEYNMRPSAPFSGLIGGSRSGYYGSTVGMRRGGASAMSSRKPKMPSTEYPPDYASNDLMNSFNGGGGNSPIPSLRELATYASRYGPAYLRERFGAHESGMERMPYGGPQVPPRGGGIPIDFNMNIASNHWNGAKGIGSPIGIMSRDVDSYQHDDATKANSGKKTGRSTTTGSPETSSTTSSKPKKARKPAKKASSSTTTTTTTSKPEKKTNKKSA
ncbi:unnamed protein product [Caenorhabditis sp. 36 PRJEB53466]|nr:unnamed protein product [Caenorhabditis sp. 36 PRJEB53466]